MAHLRGKLLPSILVVLAVAAAVAPASEARHLHRVSRVFNVAGLCGRAPYVKLCEAVVASKVVSSPQSLVEAAAQTAAVKAQHAQVVAGQLMSATGTQKVLHNILKSCQDSYASAADALEKAQRLVRSGGRYADINNELSAAGTFVTTCQDSFDEFSDVDSPIAHVQTNLSRLVSNTLNLATVLQH